MIGAGDSDTDVTMVRDATGAHIVLNRNKPELPRLRRRGRPLDRQPDFIAPLPRLKAPYPCATTAHVRADGTESPVIGRHGKPIPDQRDTTFGSS